MNAFQRILIRFQSGGSAALEIAEEAIPNAVAAAVEHPEWSDEQRRRAATDAVSAAIASRYPKIPAFVVNLAVSLVVDAIRAALKKRGRS